MSPSDALHRLERATLSYHRIAVALTREGAPAGSEDSLERARQRVQIAENELRIAIEHKADRRVA